MAVAFLVSDSTGTIARNGIDMQSGLVMCSTNREEKI